jgi:hypothetical protein
MVNVTSTPVAPETALLITPGAGVLPRVAFMTLEVPLAPAVVIIRTATLYSTPSANALLRSVDGEVMEKLEAV